MRTTRAMAMLGLMVGAASCAPKAAPVAERPPVYAPPPRQTPPPSPPPVVGWEDKALTPGEWTYREEGPSASYAAFTMRCERAGRRVVLTRQGAAGALVIRTSFGARTLPAGANGEVLSASDPLLDQIVFSRGRVSVEAEGLPALTIPTWPEPARVIDECRG
ncbi:MAG TPA: hypothetical protein VGC35_05660 [Allosphingosinicella sp.]